MNTTEREPVQHHLKSRPEPFHQVRVGLKNFEIRVNDRDYRDGDTVVLKEYDPASKTYSGLREGPFTIGTVIPGGAWGLPENVCVFALLWNPEGAAIDPVISREVKDVDAAVAHVEALVQYAHTHPDEEIPRAVVAARWLLLEVYRLREMEARVNHPETENFLEGVRLEAEHQRQRWNQEEEAKKSPEDWMWVVAYLVTKATQAARYNDPEKYKHHIITSAAALFNWHRHATAAPRIPE